MHTLLAQSQLNVQNQGIKGAQWAIQSEKSGGKLFCINSTSVISLKMNNLEDQILTQFIHRSMEFAYKLTEDRLKGDPDIGVCIQALETAECL